MFKLDGRRHAHHPKEELAGLAYRCYSIVKLRAPIRDTGVDAPINLVNSHLAESLLAVLGFDGLNLS